MYNLYRGVRKRTYLNIMSARKGNAKKKSRISNATLLRKEKNFVLYRFEEDNREEKRKEKEEGCEAEDDI